MDAKEKAKELVDKFFNRVDFNRTTYYNWSKETAKQCALIAVDEIIVVIEELFVTYGIGFLGNAEIRNDVRKWEPYKFYQQVKEEINQQ